MIAGGDGFLGSALSRALEADGHETWWLTRRPVSHHQHTVWDGEHLGRWSDRVSLSDAVINVTGHSLAHWPWTNAQKRLFFTSRVKPTQALTTAIASARTKPEVYIQTSGINYYGLAGETPADEATSPADDFLARLSVEWEAASEDVASVGVRRVITRNALVLDARAGMLPLMSLPIRLCVGGRLADGRQAVPWIHISDYVDALTLLIRDPKAQGPFNIVAPMPTSSEQFMRALARALRRPYWLPIPQALLELPLGEMSVLLTGGRVSLPKRLPEMGYHFRFPSIEEAFSDLYATRA